MIKKVIASYKKRRDDKFIERIDRVYFRHSGDGIRYVNGLLVAVKDEKTGRHGGLSSGDFLTYKDAVSVADCSNPQADYE